MDLPYWKVSFHKSFKSFTERKAMRLTYVNFQTFPQIAFFRWEKKKKVFILISWLY